MTRDEIDQLRRYANNSAAKDREAIESALAEIADLRATLIGWVELGEEMRRILENDVLIADWFAPRLYAALARGSAPTRDPVTPQVSAQQLADAEIGRRYPPNTDPRPEWPEESER